jgi:hypothetical protein
MEFSLHGIAIEIRIFVYLSFKDGGCGFEGGQSLYPLLAKVVQDLVGGDPVYPCKKLRIPPEGRKRSPDLYEYVLEEVVGIFVAAKEAAHVPIDPLCIVLDYLIEGLLMSTVAV